MEPWLESFAQTVFQRSSDTAHDLKTPLNVAVLNLELLRMRLRKLAGGDDDPKVLQYAQAIETELRRLAQIFDAFFVLSTPPKGEAAPEPVDVCAICAEVASAAGYEIAAGEPLNARVHDSRIRQALKLFFDGAAHVLRPEGRQAEVLRDGQFSVAVSGFPAAEDFELTRIFKFYYTDSTGNPDISLAAARLIVETYGGKLNAAEESDKVVLRISVPLGEE